MGFDFTKKQLAKIKEKVEELDQEHSDVEGFDFDASEARFMQKLEKKMEDPLVLELRQEFTKAIQFNINKQSSANHVLSYFIQTKNSTPTSQEQRWNQLSVDTLCNHLGSILCRCSCCSRPREQ